MARFIAFEGLDGSGKSTLIQALATHLAKAGLAHVLTREPGGTELGEEIRELLLRTQGEAPSPRAELLLYQAGRAQHVDRRIRPALQRGEWVISDRYYASTVAFQCGARGLNRAQVDALNRYAVDGVEPDLWVLVDVPVSVSFARLQSRASNQSTQLDRFELEKQDFHERVRKSYLEQAAQNPSQWLVLDGQNQTDQLQQELLAELRRRGWLTS